MFFNIPSVQIFKSTGVFDGLMWSKQDDGTYTQTITVNGVKANSDLIVSPVDEYKDIYKTMGCMPISQADNSITFKSYKPDDIAVLIEVIIINF